MAGPSNHRPANNTNTSNPAQSSQVTCYQCSQRGHIAPNCTSDKQPWLAAITKEESQNPMVEGTPELGQKMITTLMIILNMIINQCWIMIKIMNHH
jgi:hypothetical protein